jgi:hypothetical protein
MCTHVLYIKLGREICFYQFSYPLWYRQPLLTSDRPRLLLRGEQNDPGSDATTLGALPGSTIADTTMAIWPAGAPARRWQVVQHFRGEL